MKIWIICSLFLSVCLTGSDVNTKTIPTTLNTSKTQFQLQKHTIIGELKIIHSITTVKRGGVGIITIQGKPGIKYNIKSSFKLGDKLNTVTQWRIADSNGQATFNWVVSTDTVPGTYSAIISGGGKIIKTEHTVLP